jgi:putative transposase
MCCVLKASPRGFYTWCNRREKDELRKEGQNQIVEKIREYQGKEFRYGSPRIQDKLRKDGRFHSRKRVAKLMKDNKLNCRLKRAIKRTTYSKGDKNVAPDLVKRNFSADRPNELWTSDITYLRVKNGWVYLCVVLDIFSRKVVGWSLESRMTQRLVLRAMAMAIKRRRHCKGVIFHTDRGSQYKANSVVKLCEKAGIIRSMGETGTCYDNAITESFNGTLKDEILFPYIPRHDVEARILVGRYIELYYNHHRMHSSLNNCSPMEFEIKWWRQNNPNIV